KLGKANCHARRRQGHNLTRKLWLRPQIIKNLGGLAGFERRLDKISRHDPASHSVEHTQLAIVIRVCRFASIVDRVALLVKFAFAEHFASFFRGQCVEFGLRVDFAVRRWRGRRSWRSSWRRGWRSRFKLCCQVVVFPCELVDPLLPPGLFLRFGRCGRWRCSWRGSGRRWRSGFGRWRGTSASFVFVVDLPVFMHWTLLHVIRI